MKETAPPIKTTYSAKPDVKASKDDKYSTIADAVTPDDGGNQSAGSRPRPNTYDAVVSYDDGREETQKLQDSEWEVA